VAQEAGLFQEHGLDLETTYISSAPTSMAALLGHEVDFLSGGVEAAVASGVEGADVVVLASSLNKVMQAIHTAPSIREPAELRGKAFGVTRIGAQSDSAARYLLRQWSLDPERDVTMIQTGGHPETLAALRSGSLEAGIISPPQSLAAQDLGFAELGNLWTRSLEYPGNVIVSRRLTQPESEEVARRLIRTQVLAIHRMLTDRPLAIRALLVGTRSEDVSVAERTYDLFGPYFERDLRLSRAAFRTALDDLAQSNPRATGVDPESVLDARFVDEIAASGLVERLYGSSH
jgi:NitT/TauT family transport system substrate-binding protein